MSRVLTAGQSEKSLLRQSFLFIDNWTLFNDFTYLGSIERVILPATFINGLRIIDSEDHPIEQVMTYRNHTNIKFEIIRRLSRIIS